MPQHLRSVGERREGERYGGNPKTSRRAANRKFLDLALTPKDQYMDEAVKETGDVLHKSGQGKIDEKATQELYGTKANPSKMKTIMARETRMIKPKIAAHRAQRRKIIASRKAY
jgi:hypothetical protein